MYLGIIGIGDLFLNSQNKLAYLRQWRLRIKSSAMGSNLVFLLIGYWGCPARCTPPLQDKLVECNLVRTSNTMDSPATVSIGFSPRIIICSISLLTSLLAVVALVFSAESARLGQAWFNQSIAMLILFGFAGCVTGLAQEIPPRLVSLAVQLGTIWLLSIPYTNPFLVCIYMVIALIVEVAMVFPAWSVVAVSAASLGLIFTSPGDILAFGVDIAARPPGLATLFVLVVVIFTACAMVIRQTYLRAVKARNIETQLEDAMWRLVDTNMKLQDYATIVELQAMNKERKRIGQEVHDILGHTLATVNMTLQALIGMIRTDEDPRLLSMLGAARLHVKEGMLELRRALSILVTQSEVPFYDMPRILRLTRNVAQATGLRVDLEFGNTQSLGTQDQAAVIYRLVQEGITNAIRHGNASQVDIHFQNHSGGLKIYITDNGRGVGYNEVGFGIDSMHKRLSEIGATLTIEPNMPSGTTLRAWIPPQSEEVALCKGSA